MKIGNNGNLVLGPFDESTPCLVIVLMNCQTKLRINHLTAVKSVTILESNANLNFCTWKKNTLYKYNDGVTQQRIRMSKTLHTRLPDKIVNVIEEAVDLARQINLGMDNDDVQELLDSHNQELIIVELIVMHEQQQGIEELESLDAVQSEDRIAFHVYIVELEIDGVAIYHPFGEFRRANSYCHLYGAQGQRQGVLLAPFHDEFRGPRSDYVR
ncbi:alpha-2 adrenergic receptor [Trichonephila clavipes]|nr:alpha-2 adrenergic receptor [Trichonephila clavipes]